MTKQEVLSELRQLLATGQVTQEDLSALLAAQVSDLPLATLVGQPRKESLSAKVNFHDLLYYVGGAVVLVGLGVFIGQNWSNLGSLVRILTTLGAFAALFAAAAVWSSKDVMNSAANIFFLLAYLLLPLGLVVTLHEAGVKDISTGLATLLTALSAVTALGGLLAFKSTVHLFFSFVYTTFFVLALDNWIYHLSGVPQTWRMESYFFFGLGASYLAFGRYFTQSLRTSMASFADFFGLAAVVSAGLALGGWKPEANMFWEIIFPLLAFALIFVSLPFKSRQYLVFGLLALMVYIAKITSEYFANSLGWPLAVVVAGLLIMGSGFLALSLRKRYQLQSAASAADA